MYIRYILLKIFTAYAWTLECPFPSRRMHALSSRKNTCLGTQCPTLSEERVLMLMSRSNTLQYCFDNLSSLGDQQYDNMSTGSLWFSMQKKLHLAAYSICSRFATCSLATKQITHHTWSNPQLLTDFVLAWCLYTFFSFFAHILV